MTGAEIRQHRLTLGLTQAELAAVIDTSASQVSRWECGRVRACRIAIRAIQNLTARTPRSAPPD